MNKTLLRIVALLLVPCLIADPVTASVFSLRFPQAFNTAVSTQRFEEEAIVSPLVRAIHFILQNKDAPHEEVQLIKEIPPFKNLRIQQIRETYEAGKMLSDIAEDPPTLKRVAIAVGKTLASDATVLSVGFAHLSLEREIKRRFPDKPIHFVGVDLNPQLRAEAVSNKLRLAWADGEHLPFQTHSFDTVLFSESIGHMGLQESLSEAYRVLRPGGQVFILTYGDSRRGTTDFGYRNDDPDDVVKTMQALGYQEADTEYYLDPDWKPMYLATGMKPSVSSEGTPAAKIASLADAIPTGPRWDRSTPIPPLNATQVRDELIKHFKSGWPRYVLTADIEKLLIDPNVGSTKVLQIALALDWDTGTESILEGLGLIREQLTPDDFADYGLPYKDILVKALKRYMEFARGTGPNNWLIHTEKGSEVVSMHDFKEKAMERLVNESPFPLRDTAPANPLAPNIDSPAAAPDAQLVRWGEEWRRLLAAPDWDDPGYALLMQQMDVAMVDSLHGGQRLLPSLRHSYSREARKKPVYTPVPVNARTVLRGFAIYIIDRSFSSGFSQADIRYLRSLIQSYNAQPEERVRLTLDVPAVFVTALSYHFRDSEIYQKFCLQLLHLPEPERSAALGLSLFLDGTHRDAARSDAKDDFLIYPAELQAAAERLHELRNQFDTQGPIISALVIGLGRFTSYMGPFLFDNTVIEHPLPFSLTMNELAALFRIYQENPHLYAAYLDQTIAEAQQARPDALWPEKDPYFTGLQILIFAQAEDPLTQGLGRSPVSLTNLLLTRTPQTIHYLHHMLERAATFPATTYTTPRYNKDLISERQQRLRQFLLDNSHPVVLMEKTDADSAAAPGDKNRDPSLDMLKGWLREGHGSATVQNELGEKFEFHYQGPLHGPGEYRVTVSHEGATIGHVRFEIKGKIARLPAWGEPAIIVSQDYRRKGVAQSLVGFAARISLLAGAEDLQATGVEHTDIQLIRFYKGIGFVYELSPWLSSYYHLALIGSDLSTLPRISIKTAPDHPAPPDTLPAVDGPRRTNLLVLAISFWSSKIWTVHASKWWDSLPATLPPLNEAAQCREFQHYSGIKTWQDMGFSDFRNLKGYVDYARLIHPQAAGEFLRDQDISRMLDENDGIRELVRRVHPYTLQALENGERFSLHARFHEVVYYYLFARRLKGQLASGGESVMNVDPHTDSLSKNSTVWVLGPQTSEVHTTWIDDSNWAAAAVQDELAREVLQVDFVGDAPRVYSRLFKEKDSGRVIYKQSLDDDDALPAAGFAGVLSIDLDTFSGWVPIRHVNVTDAEVALRYLVRDLKMTDSHHPLALITAVSPFYLGLRGRSPSYQKSILDMIQRLFDTHTAPTRTSDGGEGDKTPLSIEVNSWWGWLYGHFIQGDAHVQSMATDPEFQEHLMKLRQTLRKIFDAGLLGTRAGLDLVNDQLLTGKASRVAEIIAAKAAAWEEAGELMRGVDEEIYATVRGGGITLGDVLEIADQIVDLQILAAVKRHSPRVYLKGQAEPVDAAPYTDRLRDIITSWGYEPLYHYVTQRLIALINRTSDPLLAFVTHTSIFNGHSISNTTTHPGDPLLIEGAPSDLPPFQGQLAVIYRALHGLSYGPFDHALRQAYQEMKKLKYKQSERLGLRLGLPPADRIWTPAEIIARDGISQWTIDKNLRNAESRLVERAAVILRKTRSLTALWSGSSESGPSSLRLETEPARVADYLRSDSAAFSNRAYVVRPQSDTMWTLEMLSSQNPSSESLSSSFRGAEFDSHFTFDVVTRNVHAKARVLFGELTGMHDVAAETGPALLVGPGPTLGEVRALLEAMPALQQLDIVDASHENIQSLAAALAGDPDLSSRIHAIYHLSFEALNPQLLGKTYKIIYSFGGMDATLRASDPTGAIHASWPLLENLLKPGGYFIGEHTTASVDMLGTQAQKDAFRSFEVLRGASSQVFIARRRQPDTASEGLLGLMTNTDYARQFLYVLDLFDRNVQVGFRSFEDRLFGFGEEFRVMFQGDVIWRAVDDAVDRILRGIPRALRKSVRMKIDAALDAQWWKPSPDLDRRLVPIIESVLLEAVPGYVLDSMTVPQEVLLEVLDYIAQEIAPRAEADIWEPLMQDAYEDYQARVEKGKTWTPRSYLRRRAGFVEAQIFDLIQQHPSVAIKIPANTPTGYRYLYRERRGSDEAQFRKFYLGGARIALREIQKNTLRPSKLPARKQPVELFELPGAFMPASEVALEPRSIHTDIAMLFAQIRSHRVMDNAESLAFDFHRRWNQGLRIMGMATRRPITPISTWRILVEANKERLKELGPRDALVLRRLILEGKSQPEIAEELGVTSRQAVSVILKDALAHLQEHLASDNPMDSKFVRKHQDLLGEKELNAREKWILQKRFVEGFSQRYLAIQLGVQKKTFHREEKAALDHFRQIVKRKGLTVKYSITPAIDGSDVPKHVVLEAIRGGDAKLLDEWDPPSVFEKAWEHAAAGRGEGFQMVSVDVSGRRHLEGWVMMFEAKDHITLSPIEIAPWNRSRQKYKGVGSVLTSRVMEESKRLGYQGAFHVAPTTEDGIRFFKNMGAHPTGVRLLGWRVDQTTAEKFLALQKSRSTGIPVMDLTNPDPPAAPKPSVRHSDDAKPPKIDKSRSLPVALSGELGRERLTASGSTEFAVRGVPGSARQGLHGPMGIPGGSRGMKDTEGPRGTSPSSDIRGLRIKGRPALVIAIMGRVNAIKGIAEGLEIAHQVSHRLEVPVHMHIQGAVVSSGYYAQLVQERRRLGLEHDVMFEGPFTVSDLPEVFNRLDPDIVLIPSVREGSPQILPQMMSLKAAIVAADVGGIRESLSGSDSQETAGIVIPRDDQFVEHAVTAVAQLYENPPLRSRLAEKARRVVENRFSDRKVFPKWLALFQRFLPKDKQQNFHLEIACGSKSPYRDAGGTEIFPIRLLDFLGRQGLPLRVSLLARATAGENNRISRSYTENAAIQRIFNPQADFTPIPFRASLSQLDPPPADVPVLVASLRKFLESVQAVHVQDSRPYISPVTYEQAAQALVEIRHFFQTHDYASSMSSPAVHQIVQDLFPYTSDVLQRVFFFPASSESQVFNLSYVLQALSQTTAPGDIGLGMFSDSGRLVSLAHVTNKRAYGTPYVIREGGAETQVQIDYLSKNGFSQEERDVAAKIIYLLAGLTYHYADAISIHSQETQTSIQSLYGISKAKFYYIPNSVDTEQFRRVPEASPRYEVTAPFSLQWSIPRAPTEEQAFGITIDGQPHHVNLSPDEHGTFTWQTGTLSQGLHEMQLSREGHSASQRLVVRVVKPPKRSDADDLPPRPASLDETFPGKLVINSKGEAVLIVGPSEGATQRLPELLMKLFGYHFGHDSQVHVVSRERTLYAGLPNSPILHPIKAVIGLEPDHFEHSIIFRVRAHVLGGKGWLGSSWEAWLDHHEIDYFHAWLPTAVSDPVLIQVALQLEELSGPAVPKDKNGPDFYHRFRDGMGHRVVIRDSEIDTPYVHMLGHDLVSAYEGLPLDIVEVSLMRMQRWFVLPVYVMDPLLGTITFDLSKRILVDVPQIIAGLKSGIYIAIGMKEAVEVYILERKREEAPPAAPKPTVRHSDDAKPPKIDKSRSLPVALSGELGRERLTASGSTEFAVRGVPGSARQGLHGLRGVVQRGSRGIRGTDGPRGSLPTTGPGSQIEVIRGGAHWDVPHGEPLILETGEQMIVLVALADPFDRVLLQMPRGAGRKLQVAISGYVDKTDRRDTLEETVRAAAVREIDEELGIQIAPDDLTFASDLNEIRSTHAPILSTLLFTRITAPQQQQIQEQFNLNETKYLLLWPLSIYLHNAETSPELFNHHQSEALVRYPTLLPRLESLVKKINLTVVFAAAAATVILSAQSPDFKGIRQSVFAINLFSDPDLVVLSVVFLLILFITSPVRRWILSAGRWISSHLPSGLQRLRTNTPRVDDGSAMGRRLTLAVSVLLLVLFAGQVSDTAVEMLAATPIVVHFVWRLVIRNIIQWRRVRHPSLPDTLASSYVDANASAPILLDMNGIFQQLMPIWIGMAAEKDISFQWDALQDPLWVYQRGSIPLRTVLFEAIENAFKYTPARGKIHIRLARKGDEVLLQIRDNGEGITPEEMLHVWDDHYRSPRVIEGKKGKGMGLSLIRDVVEGHLGSVTIKSDGAGKGTVLTIRLPLAVISQPTAAPNDELSGFQANSHPIAMVIALGSSAWLTEMTSTDWINSVESLVIAGAIVVISFGLIQFQIYYYQNFNSPERLDAKSKLIDFMGRYFKIKSFEKHGLIYERVGVQYFQRVFARIRRWKSGASFYGLSGNLSNFITLTKHYELIHSLVALLGLRLILLDHEMKFRTIIETILQVYLIMLQRYNRGRVQKLIDREQFRRDSGPGRSNGAGSLPNGPDPSSPTHAHPSNSAFLRAA